MTGKQLKNSILQWAIQGKLVPQDPNDEPASVLLEKIRAEKARLIKEGKIKKDKKESLIYRGEDNSYYEKFADGKVVCIDEEVPFEIPDNWCFARLGCVCDYLHRGKSPKYGTAQVLPIIAQKCNQWDKIYTDRCLFSDLSFIDKYTAEQYLQKGDIIINSTGGGTVGRTGIIEDYLFEKYPKYVADSHVTVVRGNRRLSPRYIYYYLISPIIQTGIEERCSGSTNQIELGTSTIYNYLITVPPYKEQLRIVELMKVILQKVEKYGREQEKLENLSKLLPIHLKKSILQEAIQGRLVPQDPNDEVASVLLQRIKEEKLRLVKEGKLKKKDVIDSTIFRGDDNKYFEKKGKDIACIDEEIPFEIPETWVWVRLDNICEYIQRGKSPKYSPIKKYPVIAQKCNQWSGFSIEKAQFIVPETISSYGEERKLQNRDLLWNSTGLGTLGRMAIYYSKLNPYELAVADSHVTVIRAFKQYVCPEYLYAYFSSYTVQSVIEDKSDGSTKQKELATNTVKDYLVPLPPYEEQKRIVNRIDEILAHLTL